MSGATVPNTITDQQYADLSRRAQKVAPPMFSTEAVEHRKASAAQQRKAGQS
ncbi:hypothetical protein ACQRWP_23790 [Micromonospora trifolii]|uniref:hypothetical protein n=1 Tax=Micromonospora trifolii TaxID=2911208 RepID=UPI003D2EB578